MNQPSEESDVLLPQSDSLYDLSLFRPPDDRHFALRVGTLLRVVYKPALLSCLCASAWSFVLYMGYVPSAPDRVDASTWSFVGIALALLLALRTNANYERYVTTYRRLTSVCFLTVHFAEYLHAQVLRSRFSPPRDPKMPVPKVRLYIANELFYGQSGGSLPLYRGRFFVVDAVALLADIGSLISMIPMVVRYTFASARKSRFRPPSDLLLSPMLQQELALLECSLDTIKGAVVRRVGILIEAGLVQASTGQVAFRTLNQMVDHIGQLGGCRRTFMPFVHRDLFGALLILYVLFLPYVLWPELDWFIIPLIGLLGAILGGVLEAAAAMRECVMVDDKERAVIGVQSRLWVEESGRQVVSIFRQLDDELRMCLAEENG